MDSIDWIVGAVICTLIVTVFGGIIVGTSYSQRLRADCIAQNTQRSAGDVIAICGKP